MENNIIKIISCILAGYLTYYIFFKKKSVGLDPRKYGWCEFDEICSNYGDCEDCDSNENTRYTTSKKGSN